MQDDLLDVSFGEAGLCLCLGLLGLRRERQVDGRGGGGLGGAGVVGDGRGLAVGVEDAVVIEGGLHGELQLDDLLFVGLAGGEEDDEEGEEQGDEVGVGDQPALVIDVLGMLLLRHDGSPLSSSAHSRRAKRQPAVVVLTASYDLCAVAKGAR